MSVIIKRKLVEEEIVDEEGNVLGKICFNPNDVRIINKLSKIMVDIQKVLKKAESMGDIPVINQDKLSTLEEFQKSAEDFEKINNMLNLETDASREIIEDLSSVLGKETIEIFTGGTYDLNTLDPLLDFIIPHIKKARKSKIDNYLNSNSDVMN